MDLGRFGWVCVVLGGFGWLWVVLASFGWFWLVPYVLVTGKTFPMKIMKITCE